MPFVVKIYIQELETCYVQSSLFIFVFSVKTVYNMSFILLNFNYNSDLANPNSAQFKTLANQFCAEVSIYIYIHHVVF